MGELTIGISFAMLPAVVFVCSMTFADGLLRGHGRRAVFVVGNLMVASFTFLLGLAIFLPDGLPFVLYCLAMQAMQGVGSCLAEAASFALVAELYPDKITLFLGLNEAFTGIGVAIGPPLGGVLYSHGGFPLPFTALALALLPGVAFVHFAFRASASADADGEEDADDDDEEEALDVRSVLGIRQVLLVVIACVLSESALTFVMPTFADHAMRIGLAADPAAIGSFFAINALAYTLSAPLVGLVTSKANARWFVVGGMLLIALPCFFLGPSPLVAPLLDAAALPLGVPIFTAFAVLGLGEGLTMAPLMEDMMASCGARAPEYVDALSAVMTGSYALGEVLGPISGTRCSYPHLFDETQSALQ